MRKFMATSLLLASMMLMGLTFPTIASTSSSQMATAPCQGSKGQALANQPGVDQNTAIAVANGATEFKAAASNAKVVLNGLSYLSKWDPKTCTATPMTLFITFVATRARGEEYSILVGETVPPASVISVETMPLSYAILSTTTTSVHLSGYQFCAGSAYCSGTNNEIYDAYEYFAQPSIDYPANHGSNQPGCGSPSDCVLSTWTGLSNLGTPSSTQTFYLLQAGSFDYVRSSGHYNLFWENLTITSSGQTSGAVNLCSTSNNIGDVIYAHAYETSFTGNTGYWYLYADDVSINVTCEPVIQGLPVGEIHWKVIPYYANYMLERPQYATLFGQPLYFDLPYFSTYNIYGQLYYSGSYHTLTTPYSNNWGSWFEMTNSATLNVCSGSYSSPSCSESVTNGGPYNQWGTFPNVWITSQYT